MGAILDLQYFEIKMTNDNIINVLQRQTLKCINSLLLNVRHVVDLKNSCTHLLLLPEITALHPILTVTYLTLKPNEDQCKKRMIIIYISLKSDSKFK